MPKIQNYEVYTARMQKSVYDKMFFVDKIFNENIDTFIDFGCADAELIRHLRVFMPEVRFIGYDIDDNMIAKAKQNAPWAEFYSNWDDIKVDPAHTIINLSSIIHEIYSYCSPIDIETFWNRICNTGFAYITIRDMFPIPSTPCSQIYRERVIKAGYESELMDFERHWGLVTYCTPKGGGFLLQRHQPEPAKRNSGLTVSLTFQCRFRGQALGLGVSRPTIYTKITLRVILRSVYLSQRCGHVRVVLHN